MENKTSIFFRVLIGLICLFPFSFLAFLSVSKGWAYPHILPASYSLDNWKELGRAGNAVTTGLGNSILIAFLVALSATVTGFFVSRFIAYHKKKSFLLLITYFPFALSPVIFAACLRFYFISAGLAGNLAGIILAQLFITFPYSVIFLSGFWNENILQYQQLVNTLGGSGGYAIRKIIFPIARPICMVCFFQCFFISWFEYGLTSTIGFGKVKTLPIAVFQFISEANIFQAAVACCVLIVPPVLLTWINRKFIFQ